MPHAEHGATIDGVRPKGDPTTPVTIIYAAEPADESIPARSADTRGSMTNPTMAGLEHMWGVEIIRGVQRVARQHGVGVVLTEFGPDRNTIRYWIDDPLVRRPTCLVTVAQLSEQRRNRLRARSIPFVVLDPLVELPSDVRFVGATNWRGGRSATRHLIELGHRHIAMIGGPQHVFCQARLDGYRSALDAAGLPMAADLVVSAGLTPDDGHAAAVALLNRSEPPTAIFTCNDLQALGVYQAARELGLRIPDDLSVVGFDDLPIATQVYPALTTIRQPLAAMAAAATELALALGRGEPAAQIGVELATSLRVRQSTAALCGYR